MLASILYDYGRFSVEVKSTLLLGAYGGGNSTTPSFEALTEREAQKKYSNGLFKSIAVVIRSSHPHFTTALLFFPTNISSPQKRRTTQSV